MVNQIALGVQKIFTGEFGCKISYNNKRYWVSYSVNSPVTSWQEFLGGKTLVDRAACAQQADSYGGFGPSMSPCDFLHLVALEIVPGEDHTVVFLAGLQNAPDVDGRQIDLGGRGKLGKRLQE